MDDYTGGWWLGPRWVGRAIGRWMLGLFGHRALEDFREEIHADRQSFDINKFGRSICPCGYSEECGIQCGYGHFNGKCPSRHDLNDPATISAIGDAIIGDGEGWMLCLRPEHIITSEA